MRKKYQVLMHTLIIFYLVNLMKKLKIYDPDIIDRIEKLLKNK